MKKTFPHIVGALTLALFGLNTQAAVTTATFPISTTVQASCALSSVTGITFANYTPNADLTGTGSITTTCTKTTTYTLSISVGSGTMATRTLGSSGSDKLNYNLYTTNAYTTVFGDGTASSATVAGTGTGVAQTTTVYGKVPLNQFVTPGAYSETLTVTATY